MGDRRKLQSEIDRCLKKVAEGVETFEDIWQKVHSAPNHNQKDKYEQELKKEIKKLQRLRDQIKAWISSTEIKDKKSLQEARKNIEQQMERFKVVERETKTKAYSKEGLGAGLKLDPQEKEKEECNQWIADAIHELNIQIYKFEADIESLSVSLKKKKSDKEKLERLEETKSSIERHKYHVESLEKILRAINNDALDPKSIHNLRADIEYYVESNQDSDFKENELMYEEIDLENLSTLMTPVTAAPTTQSHPPLLTNGTTNSGALLPTITSTLMDIHTLSNHTPERTMTINSNHTDSEPTLVLTTPSSSTQASSPSASPALSLTDERKRNKSESEDNHSQRNRSNSGVNQGSSSYTTHISSPKNPSGVAQQSPSVLSNSKTTQNSTPSSASTLSSSAPSHFPYPAVTSSSTTATPTTTVPGVQYSAIVIQNTGQVASANHSNTSKASPQLLSPPIKQQLRPMTNGNGTSNTSMSNDSTAMPPLASTSPLTSTLNTNTSTAIHPSSLMPSATNNDRTGSNNMHLPLDSSALPSTSMDPIGTSQSSILTRSGISDIDRTAVPFNNLPGTLLGNGSSDSHALIENTFPSVQSSSSSFLPTLSTDMTSTAAPMPTNTTTNGANGGVIGQLSNAMSINSDHHHPLRVLMPSNSINQPSVATGRVPLTPTEIRVLNRLNSAYTKLPSLLESERQRTNANRIYGRNPLSHGQMIPYYPQTPPSGSDSAEFYYRLAPDTLFFVFYYMEGTRAQYLAAKALKRQSWRFHTKHMMWFQRHEEPKTITDDYEQGTYIFFDYERWQTRKRDNFMFEYKFLEDREF